MVVRWSIGFVLLWLASSAAPASAQIYEWRDSTGSRHFTNDIEDIPEALREAARVVVRARAVPAAAEPASEPTDLDSDPSAEDRRRARRAERSRYDEPEPPRQAQVIYDHSFRFARPRKAAEPAPQQVPQVQVNIAGPFAVSQVVVPEPQVPPVDYFYGFGGGIPLGLRPTHRGGRELPPAKPGSVLAPAPLAPGSPSFMPTMRSIGPRSSARR